MSFTLRVEQVATVLARVLKDKVTVDRVRLCACMCACVYMRACLCGIENNTRDIFPSPPPLSVRLSILQDGLFPMLFPAPSNFNPFGRLNGGNSTSCPLRQCSPTHTRSSSFPAVNHTNTGTHTPQTPKHLQHIHRGPPPFLTHTNPVRQPLSHLPLCP